MILCLSSSGREAIAAFCTESGSLLHEHRQSSWPRRTLDLDCALEYLISESGTSLQDVSRIVVDVGPGSFTGIKVAVTMGKVMGYALDVKVGPLLAFDLLPESTSVAIAIKKGQWAVREGDRIEIASSEEPPTPVWHAASDEQSAKHSFNNLERILQQVDFEEPQNLMPFYATEPSISKPRPRGFDPTGKVRS